RTHTHESRRKIVTQGTPAMVSASVLPGRAAAASPAGGAKVASSVQAGICSRMFIPGPGGRPLLRPRNEMKLIIEDDEGRKTVVPVVREEITIGRQDGNTIRLTERNVSRRHARLVKENGNLLIEDLGSYNGVRVNGEKISGPTKIKEGDLVEIGDYDLGIQGKLDATAPTPPGSAPKQSTIPPGTVKAPQAVKQAAAPQPAPQPADKTNPNIAAPVPTEKTPLIHPPTPAPGPSAGGATAIIRVSD